MSKTRTLLFGWLLLWAVLILPTAALAETITFGASDPGSGQPTGVHLQSQGRVNFDWVPVTGPASLTSEYWGANDLMVFQAIGQSYVQAGQTYNVTNGYNISMWFDSAGLPNILSGDQTSTGYTTWDFFAVMNISTISFAADGNSMVIGGYLSNMLNNLTGSAVLNDLAATGSASFMLTLTANNRTAAGYPIVTALNSSALSTWTDLSGSVGMTINAVPEPGSMLLFGSAAGLLGWWRRRRGTKTPVSETV